MANPEIPSFKNPQGQPPKDGGGPPLPKKDAAAPADGKEEKKGGGIPLFGKAAAKPPTFGGASSGATPSLKIRGLGGGPKTLLERLKNFQKKDLVFIASGMGVLFLAPLAEHFMMSPTQDGTLKGGFDNKGGAGIFGPDVGPQDGTGGLQSPGNLYGASADVITPLNVRDPSALVMAPGASQVQPPPAATTVAPAAASSSRDTGGWKDALSAAKSGAEKGAEAAKPSAFRAPGNLAGALRGLSALSGGSYGGGPTFNLGAPNASNVPNRSGEGGRLSQVKAAPGYKGVGARGLDSGGGGAEALRKAAENQGNLFNRPGSAAGNLDAAAKEAIPTGSGTGGGGPGSGGDNKGGSGSTSKDNKALGESLAYLRMKMEMEKEMDLKWSKKKWKEFEFPKMIYEELTKSAIQNIAGKGMFEPLGKAMAGMWAAAAGKAGGVRCKEKGGGFIDFNDDSEFYYKPASMGGGYRVRKFKADNDQPAGTVDDIVYEYCERFGDDKGKGGNSGGAEDPNRRPRTGAPGTQDPAGEQRETDGRLDQGGAKLDGLLANCAKPGFQSDPTNKRFCEMASELKPVYATHLKQASLNNRNSGEEMITAWRQLEAASKAMEKAEDEAFKFANKLGCAAQGGTRQCEAETVLLKAQEMGQQLQIVLANIPQGPIQPTAAQLNAAKQAYETAQKALERAKAQFVSPFGGDDQRDDIRKALENAETALKNATTEARSGGKQIVAAITAKDNAMAKIANVPESQKAISDYIRPAAVEIDALKASLSAKAGRDGEDGSGSTPIIADKTKEIGRLDAVRTARVNSIRDLTCGAECKGDGTVQKPSAGMILDAINAWEPGKKISGYDLPAVPATDLTGAGYRQNADKVVTAGKLQDNITGLNNEIPKLDASLKKVNGRGQGNPEADVRGIVACTQGRNCSIPTN